MNAWAIVGAVTGVVALGYSVWAINDAHEEMNSLREEIDSLHDRVRRLEKNVPEEPSKEEISKEEFKREMAELIKEEFGDDDTDEPRGLPTPEEIREEEMMFVADNETPEWVVVDRFEYDLDETDFLYKSMDDVLYRRGSVVNDDFPELHELLYDDYYGDPNTSGHATVRDLGDPSGNVYTVSILPETD